MAMNWSRSLGALLCAVAVAGPACFLTFNSSGPGGSSGAVFETTWGRSGNRRGELATPRAVAIDAQDRVYLVDKTARIQVFTTDGDYLDGWRTPESQLGMPTGMSVSRDGLLMVADTHYQRVLFYRPDGTLLPHLTLGGTNGRSAGRIGWVTDVVQDSQGNLLVSEYGELDRIQKFTPDGEWLLEWGHHGSAPGEFSRPQSLAIDADDRLYVADACNHRIQVFDTRSTPPRLLNVLGSPGSAPGQLRYPYAVLLDSDQRHLYVLEFGNHRVQKWTTDGQPVAVWGTMGRGAGELFNPWAFALDSSGRLLIVDTYNHRVHRVRM